MSSALDRVNGAGDVPPGTPADQPGAEQRHTADIRDGVRKAHGFALTDDEIVRMVDGTIRVADQVLIAAATAADAVKPDGLPTLPAAARLSINAAPIDAAEADARQRPLPDADVLPEPRIVLPDPAASRAATLVRLGLAVAASLAVAVFIAGNPLTPDRVASSSPAAAPAAPISAEQASEPADTPPASRHVSVVAELPPAPRLVVVDPAEPGTSGAALRLGVSVEHALDETGLVIGGLPAGASLSVGRPAEMDQWYVPAAELAEAMVRPPQDFAGAMDLAVELRGPGNTAERRSVHLEWARAAVPAPPAPPAQAAAPEAARLATAAFTPRKLEPDEIASLRRRGEDFFAHGDVTAARLMLQRAAEAADARAAFALAATYDPIVLGDRGVQGVTPDPVMAKAWYERARAFGSPEAPRRLELLASREH